MRNTPALATTFEDGKTIEVEIISGPSSTGLCKVIWHEGDRTLVRNKVRLVPINDAAKELLKTTEDSNGKPSNMG